MPENTLHSTTQKFLDIFDITNNVVILKNGTASIIIQVDAMNFGLLAEEEQDSIMYAYAGLLNSLNYPIQIIIRSQTKDVTGYLQILKDQEDKTASRPQQQRIRRYREFVTNLIRERNVLDKKFYVTISATPLEVGLLAPQSFVPGQSEAQITPEQRATVLEKARNLLEPKRDHLIAQFSRIGLFSRQLTTQEIIQFFYLSYNPEASEGQHIADSNNYTTPLVTAGVEGTTMNDAPIPAMPSPAPVADTQPAQTPMPTGPVPAPATVPPQLTDTPVAPPVEPIVEQTPAGESMTTPSTAGYTPTQMPAQPTTPAAPPAQPATTEPTAPEKPTVSAPVQTQTPEPIQLEPTAPIVKPDIPKTPPASPAPAPGPTLDSSKGESDLPKPTLPMDPPTPNPTPETQTPSAVIETAEIEPVVLPPSEPTDTSSQKTEEAVTPAQTGTDLPPLPEI